MEIDLTLHPDKYLEDYKIEVYDSLEEVYFIWYLQELYEGQFINKVTYHNSAFDLSEGVWVHTNELLKTKIKKRHRQILKPHEYSHDFNIYWKPKAYGLLTNLFDAALHAPLIPFWNKISYIEVKADYDRNNMTRLFRVNQKWVWKKYNVFIQLVKLPSLFKNTFTPERYLKQNFKHGERKIHFEPKETNNFLKRLPYDK